MTRSGSNFELDLIQSGLSSNPAVQDYLGYTFSAVIKPYPQMGKEIADKDYRLEITITRK